MAREPDTTINSTTESDGPKMQLPNGINNTDKYLNGPDQVIPATEYITSEAGGHVRLRMTSRGAASERPVSVPGLLRRAVARYPDGVALATKKDDGQWHKITFRQYSDKVRTAAKAFIKLGLNRYHGVCILGFNSEEWFIADLAAIHAGGYAAGIYTTNSAEACFHCLQSSSANVCVVQDQKQLDKVLAVRERLPLLKAIVQWEGTVNTSVPGVYSWAQLMEIGEKESDVALNNVLKSIAINECCTLVYTSGTVGPPKAVMLSHDSLTWDAFAITQRCGDVQPTLERLISFLPLSHVAAQVLDIYVTLLNAIPVYFAKPDALKGSLVETLRDVRPTRFLAVPRVWEKMHEKIVAIGSANGFVKRSLGAWARGKGLEYNMNMINGYENMTCGYKLARTIVFSKVLDNLGLDQCRTFVTGAAPLSPDIKRFFLSLDIPIMDVFGMSETSGAHTLSITPKFNLDSAGEILTGVEVKFGDSDNPNGPGELMMRGRNVFMGYLNDPEKTEATFDEDGWLRSGDVGRADDKDFLYITGRIKELLITAGGENVAPVLIEQAVHAELLHVGAAVLVGDRRKFLSLLVTIKTKVNLDTGEALDELDPEARKWVASLGSKATTLAEIAKTKDPLVSKAIEDGIKRANKHAISNAQKIQKFTILPADFSMVSGELGPTLKLKRNVVYEKYKDVIEDFYKE